MRINITFCLFCILICLLFFFKCPLHQLFFPPLRHDDDDDDDGKLLARLFLLYLLLETLEIMMMENYRLDTLLVFYYSSCSTWIVSRSLWHTLTRASERAHKQRERERERKNLIHGNRLFVGRIAAEQKKISRSS